MGVGRQAAMLIVNLTLMHRLSPGAFGAFALASGGQLLLTGLSEFGLRQVGWAHLARRPHRSREVVGRVLAARSVTGLASLMIYGAFACCVCESSADATVFALFAPSLIFNAVAFDFPSLAAGRIRSLAIRVLTVYSLYAAFVFFVIAGDGSLPWAAAGWTLANAALCLSLYASHHAEHGAPIFRARPRAIARTLRRAAPLGVGFFVNRVSNNYPLLVLGVLRPREELLAYRFPDMFLIFVASFGVHLASAAFSGLARSHTNRAAASVRIERLVSATVLGAGLAAILFVFLIGDGYARVTGADASDLRNVAPMLAAAMIPATASRLLRAVAPSVGMREALAVRSTQGVLIGVGCVCLGTWSFGAAGLAGSLALSEAWLCLALLQEFRTAGYAVRAREIVAPCVLLLSAPAGAALVAAGLGAPVWASVVAVGATGAVTLIVQRLLSSKGPARARGAASSDVVRATS